MVDKPPKKGKASAVASNPLYQSQQFPAGLNPSIFYGQGSTGNLAHAGRQSMSPTKQGSLRDSSIGLNKQGGSQSVTDFDFN
jgi:hypothetical protein